ncbi:DNA helicase/exodeoxyribonuclease V alpha subunit [Plasticicumulans lactativorans]|uniref:RecBCD enzyme subunit RecD n=1 Tax=Plasticicumulans lactativorans TaxID=1133106 RepID=A0A4R2L0E5_9GAMM|nr:exodeoxyribonuclease V subunit alpha [Plasticicumulans lactativorans]TCO79703.1 DNA helicase/exodeoxyribonuclease V alpha subunit [Plasticicumulans lactativorans]
MPARARPDAGQGDLFAAAPPPAAAAGDELQRLFDAGVLSELDLGFARLLVRLGGGGPALALAAALASRAVGEGHACLDLANPGPRGRLLLPAAADAPALWAPEPAAWRAALAASPAVGAPGGEPAPLLLDAAGRLYLYRYWAYEGALAAGLRRLAAQPVDVDAARLRADLARLFPADPAAADQRRAAAVAVLSRFAVISGGPGTGKTTTLARVLAALVGQHGPGLRVRLAAPTGKAAARMEEALRAATAQLAAQGEAAATLAALPQTASTLHRLLGVRPGSVRFRHGPDAPLALDLLVIDEVSMVDLPLMAKTVAALPAQARLLLLGDRDQLASVEAGSVLADIAAQAGPPPAAFAARLGAVLGEPVAAAAATTAPLAESIALLRHSFRFDARAGIGRLAAAVNTGAAADALALLEGAAAADLGWLPDGDVEAVVDAALAGYRGYLDAVRAGAPPETLFAAFAGFQVLCAQRHGALGAQGLNARIEARARRALGLPDTPWYPGRPLLVTRNDYTLGLYNGDVGIAVATADGALRVHFPAAGDGAAPRDLPLARLPEHEPVFAMTVHKSQGSEFDRVLLVLPEADSPVLSRELLYTGITRARRHVHLAATAETLARAVARPVRRASGLAARLADPSVLPAEKPPR